MSGCGIFAGQVRIHDQFWDRWLSTTRNVAIPYQWEALNDRIPDMEPSHCMRNFRIASGKEKGQHQGWVFQDSDVAKWLEGVGYSLLTCPDPALEKQADEAIEEITAAQQPDGYLNTYYTINGLEKRFTNLRDNHELYCLGHLIEGAVAYYRATGKRRLLDAVIRYADLVDSMFGPEQGKLHGYPGHPELELALVRLYEVTDEKRYLKLSKYFVDTRGQEPLYFREEEKKNHLSPCYFKGGALEYRYYQAQQPIREQKHAEGHAVRAVYLYTAVADLARYTGDNTLETTAERMWRSIVDRRMYVTGGIGSSPYGEAFTYDYDLPNDTAYAESCASIGLIFFARRMLQMKARGEYADVIERALYNGVLSGMQMDGKKFFYVNPLEVYPPATEADQNKRHVKAERQPWFGCACCPPNIVRMLMSLHEYVFSVQEDTIYTHLYIGSEASLQTPAGEVMLKLDTGYPWDGDVRIEITKANGFEGSIAVRLPGWCMSHTLCVNGISVQTCARDGYLSVCRPWQSGDVITLSLDMPPVCSQANPRVRENTGKVVFSRGPLVYCAEEADNGPDLHLLQADPEALIRCEHRPELLNGVDTLEVSGWRTVQEDTSSSLYMPYRKAEKKAIAIRLIPYYAWANRRMGEMSVWIRSGR